jgi:hypothetical protein
MPVSALLVGVFGRLYTLTTEYCGGVDAAPCLQELRRMDSSLGLIANAHVLTFLLIHSLLRQLRRLVQEVRVASPGCHIRGNLMSDWPATFGRRPKAPLRAPLWCKWRR